MKIKFVLIYLLLIFPAMAKEKYLYFDNQNIFYYNERHVQNTNGNRFFKLINPYKLLNTKFDATFITEEENIKQNKLIKKNDQFNFKKNFYYDLIINTENLKKKNSLFFFKNNILINEFELPYFTIKNRNYIFNKSIDLIKKNILTTIKKLINPNMVLFKGYDDNRNKAKLTNINIKFIDFEKDTIIINSSADIEEVFIKFESKSYKHLGYFNKKIYHIGDEQYFSLLDEKVKKATHIETIKELKLNSGEDFYITEIQFVFNNKAIRERKINSLSLSNIFEINKESMRYFSHIDNKNNILNLNKYAKNNFDTANLNSIMMLSTIESILTYQEKSKKQKTNLIYNTNLKKLQKLTKDKNILFAEITNIKNNSKFYFILYSFFPYIFLTIFIYLISKIQIENKYIFICKNLIKIFFGIFIILFLMSVYTNLNYLGFYIYFVLIIFLVTYIILKKISINKLC